MDVKITVDDGGVTAALATAAARIPAEVRPVVARGALNIKNAMRADAAKSKHFRIAPFISYDLSGNAAYSQAEIGPEKRGAGNLANLAYFGGVHGGGGTVRDPQQAANDEAPKFEQALSDVIDGLLS